LVEYYSGVSVPGGGDRVNSISKGGHMLFVLAKK